MNFNIKKSKTRKTISYTILYLAMPLTSSTDPQHLFTKAINTLATVDTSDPHFTNLLEKLEWHKFHEPNNF